jgi:hypothetical protein
MFILTSLAEIEVENLIFDKIKDIVVATITDEKNI